MLIRIRDTYHSLDFIAYFLFDNNKEVENAEEGYFKIQCLSQLLVQAT